MRCGDCRNITFIKKRLMKKNRYVYYCEVKWKKISERHITDGTVPKWCPEKRSEK